VGSNQKEYQTLVLAALLHDIGKFWGRGKAELLEGQYPKFSADFVNTFSEVLSQVSNTTLLSELVQRHSENKQKFAPDFLIQSIEDTRTRTLATLVSRADKLASSEQNKLTDKRHNTHDSRLASVLEQLNRVGEHTPRLSHRAGVLGQPNSLEMAFPAELPDYEKDELERLVGEFKQDFSGLFTEKAPDAAITTDFDCLISHLTNLLHKYTWCLASNGRGYSDVSLYDHLRTTAAITSCLYLYHSEGKTLSEDKLSKNGVDQFCLVVGDISGIQNYIFDIASIGVRGGVARRLRARSLFVQLCCEIASHLILRKLSLPIGIHTIMNSGGRFYLLLPNTSHTDEVIKAVQHITSEWFSKELNGELALNLSMVPFGEDGFRAGGNGTGGFGSVLKEVNEALSLRKQRRFSELLQDTEGWIEDDFVLSADYQGKGPCASCRKFPEDLEGLCKHCNLNKRIGAILPNARYLVFFESGQGDIPIFGCSVSVLDSPPVDTTQGKPYLVMKINDTDLSDALSYPAMSKYLATFVARSDDCEICKETEEKENHIATFECIAGRSGGEKLLGFLKADVDHLGESFIFGLKGETTSKDTISRISTLSRMLDLFFSGWVEHLTSANQDFYTVFSGGDDLFLVGPWDKILEIAENIKSDFAKFTGNPKIKISAGVTIARHDFPIASAAEAANVALRKSKLEGGDCITILGATLNWSDWAKIRSEWEYLGPLTNDNSKVSSAFLYNLLRFYQMWAQYELWQKDNKQGSVLGLRYHPLLAYSTTRNLDPRKTPELYEWTKRLLKWPPDEPTKQILDNLGLLATLLIYGRIGGEE
jgi:CRISPR-associated protein Csm1